MVDMLIKGITDVLQMARKNKEIIFGIILVIVIIAYINRDRVNKSYILRQLYKEEYDNYDISKDYNIPTVFKKEYADPKIKDFTPTKTSELVAFCDEKREECIEY